MCPAGEMPPDCCPLDGLRKAVAEVGCGAENIAAARAKWQQQQQQEATAQAADTPFSAGLAGFGGLSLAGGADDGAAAPHHRPTMRDDSRARLITRSLASFRRPDAGWDADGFPIGAHLAALQRARRSATVSWCLVPIVWRPLHRELCHTVCRRL